jgi:hypothetical protein
MVSSQPITVLARRGIIDAPNLLSDISDKVLKMGTGDAPRFGAFNEHGNISSL